MQLIKTVSCLLAGALALNFCVMRKGRQDDFVSQ